MCVHFSTIFQYLEEDYYDYGMKLLKSGTSLEGMSKEDVLYNDYKLFTVNDKSFAVGQFFTMNFDEIESIKTYNPVTMLTSDNISFIDIVTFSVVPYFASNAISVVGIVTFSLRSFLPTLPVDVLLLKSCLAAFNFAKIVSYSSFCFNHSTNKFIFLIKFTNTVTIIICHFI